MHSFTGTAETAAECVSLGLYISFAGMVTFKKSDDLRAVAATIPADRILIETDSPYLSPHPLRGKRNEPANLVHTGGRAGQRPRSQRRRIRQSDDGQCQNAVWTVVKAIASNAKLATRP